jgi:organic hydroperoxide reductase OsmC/OhrA
MKTVPTALTVRLKMHKFPLEFNSEAKANSNFEQPWLIQSGLHQSVCAIPPEFGGHGGGFSPEDLFLQAAINCFVGTFKVVARLSKISFDDLSVSGKLTVDKNDEGKIVMKAVHLDISISGIDRPDRLETVINKSIRDGFILNSLRSQVTFSVSQTN